MTLLVEKEKFSAVTKLILKHKLSKNIETLREYRIKLINGYNRFTRYCVTKYPSQSESNKLVISETHAYVKGKLEESLSKLGCTYEISEEELSELIEENVSEPRVAETSDTDTASEVETVNGENLQEQENNNIEINMSTHMSTAEFLRMASGHINKTYSGDPLALTSFIDSIQLLQTLATSEALRTFLVAFLKTKIDGKAREFISETDDTVAAIVNKLRANIKPDNSKVIEGRILSLKLSGSNQEEFATKAEELAEAFRRSLVVEGVTPVKATEMAVDKTVELCRANARSDLVKSVLEATAFANTKDVIAKLLTQVDKAKNENQILAYKKMTDRNKNFGQNYNSHRGRGNRGGSGRGGNHSRGGYHNNNAYHNNNGGNNYNNGSNNNRGGNHRRGGNRGYHNNNNGYHNSNPSNVRVVQQSGNGETPHNMQMGAHSSQM